jgi:hypothetical protein
MAGVVDGSTIDFQCPPCSASVRTNIGEARRSPTLRCPRGHEIKVDGSQIDRELRSVDREFDNLQRTIRQLGR